MRKLNEFIKVFAVENNVGLISIATYFGEENFSTFTTGKGVSKNIALNVGELAQPIIWILAAKLVEMGKLSFSDDVSDILKKYPKNGVKVIDLLVHTAGYNAEDFKKQLPQNPGDKEYLNAFYEYSGEGCGTNRKYEFFPEGYILLAAVIEKLSERTVEQFAREALFLPLNIRNTTFDSKSMGKARYKLTDNHTEKDLRQGTAYKHLMSTAEDLTRIFSIFLNDGKYQGKQIISKTAVRCIIDVIIKGTEQSNGIISRYDARADGYLSDLNSEKAICISNKEGGMIMLDEEYRVVNVILSERSSLKSSIYRKVNSCVLGMV